MDINVNDILEKLNEGNFEPQRFIIKRLKTINHNIHAVLVNTEDESNELLVALSVLQDKNKFKLIKG